MTKTQTLTPDMVAALAMVQRYVLVRRGEHRDGVDITKGSAIVETFDHLAAMRLLRRRVYAGYPQWEMTKAGKVALATAHESTVEAQIVRRAFDRLIAEGQHDDGAVKLFPDLQTEARMVATYEGTYFSGRSFALGVNQIVAEGVLKFVGDHSLRTTQPPLTLRARPPPGRPRGDRGRRAARGLAQTHAHLRIWSGVASKAGVHQRKGHASMY